MPRKNRPLTRDGSTERDATLIVIASEDTHAVKQYFDRFRPRKCQFAVLPTYDGKSAPQHLMTRLQEYKKEYNLDHNDQLWIVCDTDRWEGMERLSQECHQADVRLAVSHPCFELWILLHFEEYPDNDSLGCREVQGLIRESIGEYSKKRVDKVKTTSDQVIDAIRRAENADHAPTNPILASTGSKVYLIMKELIEREAIIIR